MAENKKFNIAIAFGSNLGEPSENINRAVSLLKENGLTEVNISQFLTTKPVNCVPGTPDFINGALTAKWAGTPQELLTITQRIETTIGRPANHRSDEARCIDLDIIIFGDVKLESDALTIPHPRMTERLFVLQPLNEIAAEWTVTDNLTVNDLYRQLI